MATATALMADGKKKQAAARIDEQKYNVLSAHARSQGMSLADWLREAIKEKAEREGVDVGNSNPAVVATTN